LDGLIVRTLNGAVKTKFGHIYGVDPKVIMPMRLWGEAGIVKVTGKIKSKLELRGKDAMFVGYAGCSAGDTYRMYVPEINSIHESRDVQWQKRMFFDTESNQSIHAADSVELIVNNNIVPLRTIAPQMTNPITQRNVNDGAMKGQVKFKEKVEYLPEYEGSDDRKMAPSVIELERMEEEWSVVSGSAAGGWHGNQAMGGVIQSGDEQPSGASDNYYKVLQDESESESEDDDEGNDEGLYEEEATSGSSFNPTVSDVDSAKYSEQDGFSEDDEAFFERLAEMTARIDAESGTDDETSNDARDREATGANVGLRRSNRTIKAPRRLIEESGISEDKKEPNWKDCLVKVYETALVGAGIGGGF
jgi:hypothetical protein